MMNPTANVPSACSGTTFKNSVNLPEIRVRRHVLEAALDRFHEQVSEIRQREHRILDALEQLLPQIFAAVLEKELISRGRAVTFNILQNVSESLGPGRLWRRFGADTRPQRQRELSDSSLPLWFAEELPHALERSKELLEDHFDELLQCVRALESARCRLFEALDIPTSEAVNDLSWIREVQLAVSSVPLFIWPIPVGCRYLSAISCLRRFVLRKCKSNIAARIATYCDRLTGMARHAAREWLSDIQWRLDQEFSERTDNSVISAEIRKLLRERWRARPIPPQTKATLRIQSSYQRIAASAAG
jgi:hypothetical protein